MLDPVNDFTGDERYCQELRVVKKSILLYSLTIVALCEIAYLLGMNAYTLASEPEPTQ